MFSNNLVNIHQDYGAVVCSSPAEHTPLNRQYVSWILFCATRPSTFFVFSSVTKETWLFSLVLFHVLFTARLVQAVTSSLTYRILSCQFLIFWGGGGLYETYSTVRVFQNVFLFQSTCYIHIDVPKCKCGEPASKKHVPTEVQLVQRL